jgi:hypothetical protein
MGTINSSDRIAATLYSLGTLFVSGIYVYILCIREIVMMMMIIIIIIIINFVIRFIQGNYNYIPETNCVSGVCGVAAVL